MQKKDAAAVRSVFQGTLLLLSPSLSDAKHVIPECQLRHQETFTFGKLQNLPLVNSQSAVGGKYLYLNIQTCQTWEQTVTSDSAKPHIVLILKTLKYLKFRDHSHRGCF